MWHIRKILKAELILKTWKNCSNSGIFEELKNRFQKTFQAFSSGFPLINFYITLIGVNI